MMESDRRTKVPWSSWSKGLLAFSVLIATGIVVFITVDEQSMYVSVEEVVSGDYQDGANLQVHGTITDLKINDCVIHGHSAHGTIRTTPSLNLTPTVVVPLFTASLAYST